MRNWWPEYGVRPISPCSRKRKKFRCASCGSSRRSLLRCTTPAGIPAGVVQRSSDLLEDPQLAHRNFFRFLEHGEMGLTPYSGHQFRIRGYDSGPRFAAPLLGEHNEIVMRDILGMSA